jgi:adenylate cyclase
MAQPGANEEVTIRAPRVDTALPPTVVLPAGAATVGAATAPRSLASGDSQTALRVDTAKPCIALFADVVDSTKLYERLGDAIALTAIDQTVSLLTQIADKRGGEFIKPTGDGALLLFATAKAACDAAVDIQTELRNRTTETPTGIVTVDLRIGMQVGMVTRANVGERADVYGDTVNVAARIAALAAGGQIMLTDAVRSGLPPHLAACCRALGPIQLRGKAEAVPVFEMLWNVSATLTMAGPVASRMAASAAGPELVLRYGGTERVLSAKQPTVVLGRSPQCDIVVADALASRTHARVELRNGKFIVIDLSSNGTYVKTGDAPDFALKREEAVLAGSGMISFGHPAGNGGGESVVFSAK